MKILITTLAVFFFTATFAQDIVLPTPKGLTAELTKDNQQYSIELSWDGPIEGDTLTESYYIFNNFPPGDKLYLNGQINRLNSTNYTYTIKKPYAARYYFAIRADAVYPYDYKSELSDTVEVLVPSIKLPLVQIREAKRNDSGQLLVTWGYEDILDVASFHIVVNDQINKVNASEREAVIDLPEADKDKNLIVQVLAETESGVKSDPKKVFVKR